MVGNSPCVLWQIVGDFLFVLGPDPFLLLLCCCFPWRNANLAGGFAGRLLSSRLCLVLVIVDLPMYSTAGTTAFHVEFLISLTCLYQFQDRALERHRPNQREKKVIVNIPPNQSVRLLQRVM